LNNIFRYDFWDEDMLADHLIAIATSESLKKSLQDNVKMEYDKISWDDVADKCLKVYEKLKGNS